MFELEDQKLYLNFSEEDLKNTEVKAIRMKKYSEDKVDMTGKKIPDGVVSYYRQSSENLLEVVSKVREIRQQLPLKEPK